MQCPAEAVDQGRLTLENFEDGLPHHAAGTTHSGCRKTASVEQREHALPVRGEDHAREARQYGKKLLYIRYQRL